MFLGQYSPLFQKGVSRLSLPKKLRQGLSANEVILSQGFDQCIFGYDKVGWEIESAKHLESPISDEKSRQIRRYLFGFAQIIPIDSQGRVVIPQDLKSYAGIDEEVVVVGAGDHFEIWNQKKWEATQKELSNVKF